MFAPGDVYICLNSEIQVQEIVAVWTWRLRTIWIRSPFWNNNDSVICILKVFRIMFTTFARFLVGMVGESVNKKLKQHDS